MAGCFGSCFFRYGPASSSLVSASPKVWGELCREVPPRMAADKWMRPRNQTSSLFYGFTCLTLVMLKPKRDHSLSRNRVSMLGGVFLIHNNTPSLVEDSAEPSTSSVSFAVGPLNHSSSTSYRQVPNLPFSVCIPSNYGPSTSQ
jgi:hypothetical protein